MNNEYIIVNKSFIDKRIEELVKELAYHEEWYKKARDNYHNDRKLWGQADDGEMRAASDAAIELGEINIFYIHGQHLTIQCPVA